MRRAWQALRHRRSPESRQSRPSFSAWAGGPRGARLLGLAGGCDGPQERHPRRRRAACLRDPLGALRSTQSAPPPPRPMAAAVWGDRLHPRGDGPGHSRQSRPRRSLPGAHARQCACGSRIWRTQRL